MSPQQVRSLGKQLTQLLETEDWVLSVCDRDGDQMHAHALAGLCKPAIVGQLVTYLYLNKDVLIEHARENFP